MYIKVDLDTLPGVLEKLEYEVVLDTETTSVSPATAAPVHIQFGNISDRVVYWGEPEIFKPLIEFLVAKKHLLIFHNAIFDIKIIWWNNKLVVDLYTLCNQVYDTRLSLKLHNENKEADLGSWVKEQYNDPYKEVFWSKYKQYTEASLEAQIEYSCKDIDYTKLLYKSLKDTPFNLELENHIQAFNRKLVYTSVRGVRLDADYLTQLGEELLKDLAKTKEELDLAAKDYTEILTLEAWIRSVESVKTQKAKDKKVKPQFNWSSATQTKELFYDKLKLPIQKNYKTKQPSLDDDALLILSEHSEIASKLREYRTYDKMYSSFVKGIFECARKVDGVYYVHPEFDPVGTVTLRTSCKGPNYQQLPADSIWGKLRGMVIPEPGHMLIACDYQSLEVYLTAALSQDKGLLDICNSGASFHDFTVEKLKNYGITRSQAKTMNFAIIYGASEYRISKTINKSVDDSKTVLKAFWEAYPGIKNEMDRCHSLIDQGQPIDTVYGNKRRTDIIKLDNKGILRAKRQAFNFKVQSTGAGLTNRSFIAIDKELRERGIGRALFPIHDEVLIEVKIDSVDVARDIAKSLMELEAKHINLPINLIANPSKTMERWEK